MRDCRLLRNVLDGKIPPVTADDAERLSILIAKCRGKAGISAHEYTPSVELSLSSTVSPLKSHESSFIDLETPESERSTRTHSRRSKKRKHKKNKKHKKAKRRRNNSGSSDDDSKSGYHSPSLSCTQTSSPSLSYHLTQNFHRPGKTSATSTYTFTSVRPDQQENSDSLKAVYQLCFI